jgi:hypothetical protein
MRIATLAAGLGLALVACQSEPVSRTLGARCDLSSECEQRCLAPSGDWPGGFCTIACDTDANCPSGARCIGDIGGVCAFACTTNADCEFLVGGYTCQDVDPRSGGVKVKVCHG